MQTACDSFCIGRLHPGRNEDAYMQKLLACHRLLHPLQAMLVQHSDHSLVILDLVSAFVPLMLENNTVCCVSDNDTAAKAVASD